MSNTTKEELLDCPPEFVCSITAERMKDPVIAADGFSYERVAIEKWFSNHSTSPKTNLLLRSTRLTPNLTLLTLIKEWEDDQRKGCADSQSLQILKGNLVSVATSIEAQVVVQKMIHLVTSSNFCLLSPDGVERLGVLLYGVALLDGPLVQMLAILASQCQSEIYTKQEMYRELNKKCIVFQQCTLHFIDQENYFNNEVSTMQKKSAAAKKDLIIAQTTFARELSQKCSNLLRAVARAARKVKRENEIAERNLVNFQKRVTGFNKLSSEYSNQRENIKRQLEAMGSVEPEDTATSDSSSSLSPVSAGSKRGRSWCNWTWFSSTTRGSKRSKKEKDGVMEMHPGQWMYEEGQAYWHGSDFQKIDDGRGKLMVETSASSGFPMAVAYCHLNGWNGLKRDRKKAFDMLLKIEKETNGYHWAQYMLGFCYKHGHGVSKDEQKSFEYYSLTAEHGIFLAITNLVYFYYQTNGKN
jgi:hypothetical protein